MSAPSDPPVHLVRVPDRLRRPRRADVVLYNGCTCCSCCCFLAPVGNVIAALSCHRDGGRIGMLGHIGLHLLSLAMAALAGVAIYLLLGARSETQIALAAVLAIPVFPSLLYVFSRFWLPEKTLSGTRVFLVIAETVAAVLFMAGMSAASIWVMPYLRF